MTDMPTTDDEWRQRLDPKRFQVLRQAGTEPAWTGELLGEKRSGTFMCGACGQPLFASDTKFESGSGWPSFWEALDPEAVEILEDRKFGMTRVEVRCSRCHSHLGHVFPDGPKPSGQRYCMNSLALDFEPFELAGD